MVDFENRLKILRQKSADYLSGAERKQEIDLSGLSQEEIDALNHLIKAMKRH